MNKKQLGRIGMAAITEEQARRDPEGAFHIAMATMRAASRAHTERIQQTGLCEGCPPVGYPTDATRCAPCPRREPPLAR
jgi:hypothetical protein